jgi:hypothetical protein
VGARGPGRSAWRLAGVAGVAALVVAVVLTGRLVDLSGPDTPGPATTATGAQEGPTTTRDLRIVTVELDPGIAGAPADLRVPAEQVSCTRAQGRIRIVGTLPAAGGGQQRVTIDPFRPGTGSGTVEIDLDLDRLHRLRIGGPDARTELHRRDGGSGEAVGAYSEVDAAGRPLLPAVTGSARVTWWCGRIDPG